MNTELLAKANIDYANGTKRFAGNVTLYEKYLKKFKEDKHFESAKEALKTGDYSLVLEDTHAIKGVAGTLGLLDIYQCSSDIVAAIRTENSRAVPALFEKLTEAYERALEVLALL